MVNIHSLQTEGEGEQEISTLQFTSENLVKGKCGENLILCLLDSGAEISLITSDTLVKLPRDKLRAWRMEEEFEVTTACGKRTRVNRCYLIELEFGDLSCIVQVYELAGLPQQILLGQPFLRQYGAVLDYRDGTLSLCNKIKLTLPPDLDDWEPGESRLVRMEMNCPVGSAEVQVSGLVGVVYSTSQRASSLRVIPTLVTASQGVVLAVVINESASRAGEWTDLCGTLYFHPWDNRVKLMVAEAGESGEAQAVRQVHTVKREPPYHAEGEEDDTGHYDTDGTTRIVGDEKWEVDWDAVQPTPPKRTFGPEGRYEYTDQLPIPPAKRNPYATHPPGPDQYPKEVASLIDMTECVFDGAVRKHFVEMLDENYMSFMRGEDDLGYCDIIPVSIVMREGVTPVYQKPYRLPPHLAEEAQAQLDKLRRVGAICPGTSPWSSRSYLVPKSFNKSHSHLPENQDREYKYRMIIDLRQINSRVVLRNLSVWTLADCMETLGHQVNQIRSKHGNIVFSAFDLSSSFFQLALDEGSMDKCAFTLGNGYDNQALMTTCPMGLSISPGILTLVTKKTLGALQPRVCLTYADDILVYSAVRTPQLGYFQHQDDVDQVLRAFQRVNLKLHPRKAECGRTEVVFLGYRVTGAGWGVCDKHLRAIALFPPPKDLNALRRWLGLVNFFTKVIPERGSLMAPLNLLLKKENRYIWGPSQQASFEKLREILTSDRVVAHPDWSKRFHLLTDASQMAISSALIQMAEKDGVQYPMVIGYFGRALSLSEQKQSITNLELIAVLRSVIYFNTYLYGSEFTIWTDHVALTTLLNSTPKTTQMARYILTIQQFRFTIRHRSGAMHKLPDALSRREYDSYLDYQWEEALDRGFIIPTVVEKLLMEKRYQEEEVPAGDKKSGAQSRTQLDSASAEALLPDDATVKPDSRKWQPHPCLSGREVGTLQQDILHVPDEPYPELRAKPTSTSLEAHREGGLPQEVGATEPLVEELTSSEDDEENEEDVKEGTELNEVTEPRSLTEDSRLGDQMVTPGAAANPPPRVVEDGPPIAPASKPYLCMRGPGGEYWQLDVPPEVQEVLPEGKPPARGEPPGVDPMAEGEGPDAQAAEDELEPRLQVTEGTIAREEGSRNSDSESEESSPVQEVRQEVVKPEMSKKRPITSAELLKEEELSYDDLMLDGAFEGHRLAAVVERVFAHVQADEADEDSPEEEETDDEEPEEVGPPCNYWMMGPSDSPVATSLLESLALEETGDLGGSWREDYGDSRRAWEDLTEASEEGDPAKIAQAEQGLRVQALLLDRHEKHSPPEDREIVTLGNDLFARGCNPWQPDCCVLTRGRAKVEGEEPMAALDLGVKRPRRRLQMRGHSAVPEEHPVDGEQAVAPSQEEGLETDEMEDLPCPPSARATGSQVLNESRLPIFKTFTQTLETLREQDEEPDSAASQKLERQCREATAIPQDRMKLMQHLTPEMLEKKTAEAYEAMKSVVTPETLKAAQRSDVYCTEFRRYLEEGVLPDDDPRARKMMLSCHEYLMWDGVLYRAKAYRKPELTQASVVVVIPAKLVLAVLGNLHRALYHAHLGVNRMIATLQRFYIWPTLATDVAKFVASCPQCLAYKRNQGTENPPYYAKEVSNEPGQTLYIDLVGPLAKAQGFQYIFLGVDGCTRRAYGFALRSKTARTVARRFFNEILCVTGSFRCIRSDAGKEFVSSIMKHLGDLTGFSHVYSSGYSSIGQSLVERLNSTIVNSLRCMVQRHMKTWYLLVPAVVFSYNASPLQRDTLLSPFMLDHGRAPKFALEEQLTADWAVCKSRSSFIEEQHLMLKEMHAVMKEMIEARQLYNRQHQRAGPEAEKTQLGSMVFLKKPPLADPEDESKRLKLRELFTGPYVVYRRELNNTVWLRDLRTAKYLDLPVHLSRVKHLRKMVPAWYFAALQSDAEREPRRLGMNPGRTVHMESVGEEEDDE